MALPAQKPQMESSVEERLARFEVSNENIQASVQRRETRVDRLDAKVDEVDRRLTAGINEFNTQLGTLALKMEERFSALSVSRAMDRVWWLLISAALLGIMARSFEWI